MMPFLKKLPLIKLKLSKVKDYEYFKPFEISYLCLKAKQNEGIANHVGDHHWCSIRHCNVSHWPRFKKKHYRPDFQYGNKSCFSATQFTTKGWNPVGKFRRCQSDH